MAAVAAEGRRMRALRAGFERALEGATGACGLEARPRAAARRYGSPAAVCTAD